MTVKNRVLEFLSKNSDRISNERNKQNLFKDARKAIGKDENGDKILKERYFYKILEQVQMDLLTLPETGLEAQPAYFMVDGEEEGTFAYQFPRGKKGDIVLHQSVVRDLFFMYSRYGLNQDRIKVREMLKLTHKEFQIVQSRLGLVKESPPFDPETAENSSDEERKALLEGVSEKYKEYLPMLGRVKHQKMMQRLFKGKVLQASGMQALAESIAEQVNVNFEKNSALYRFHYATTPEDSPVHTILTIADIHAGLEVVDLPGCPKYSVEIAKKRLKYIADEINKMKSENVHLQIAGDIIHSFTGTMHKTAFTHMDNGMYLANAITGAYDILMEFASYIANLKSVTAVSGNHDRTSNNYKEDPYGSAAMVVYEFMKRSLEPHDIKMSYNDIITKSMVGGIGLMLSHGHLRLSKNAKDIVWNHAEEMRKMGASHIYHVKGHTHHLEIINSKSDFTTITSSSIVSGDDYSVKLGASSRPGAVGITIDKFGMDRPFPINCPTFDDTYSQRASSEVFRLD